MNLLIPFFYNCVTEILSNIGRNKKKTCLIIVISSNVKMTNTRKENSLTNKSDINQNQWGFNSCYTIQKSFIIIFLYECYWLHSFLYSNITLASIKGINLFLNYELGSVQGTITIDVNKLDIVTFKMNHVRKKRNLCRV